jgi:putative glutamine amidotransferase
MGSVLVGVPANFLSDIHHHAVSNRYLQTTVTHAHAVPIIIPCLFDLPEASIVSPAGIVSQLDGLLLTGSRSNVHPSRYGAALDPEVTLFDVRRDAAAIPLICAAVEAEVPVFGICRGAQELNCAFGGTLHQVVHAISGNLDHRAVQNVPQHLKYFPAHDIIPAPGGWLDARIKEAGLDPAALKINSLHGQAIAELGTGVTVEARAPDGVVEAISMPAAAAWTFGVQWHPEWHTEETPLNKMMFEAFREACSRRHAERVRKFYPAFERTRAKPKTETARGEPGQGPLPSLRG